MTGALDHSMLRLEDRAMLAREFFDLESPAVNSFPPPPVGSVPRMAPPFAAPPFATPQLPTPKPMAAPTPTAAFDFAMASAVYMPTPPAVRGKKRRSGARRLFSWVLVLGVVGGLVYAGITYGPELLDRAQGESTTDGPAAPLAFPPVVVPVAPPRTATFMIERPLDDGSMIRYEVTNDFETGMSRMLIDRTPKPDLEVLAVFDVANLHEVDQAAWFSMPRGDFPLVTGTERSQWIRTVDDYFPAALRPHVTITRATESLLGAETMRHLVIEVDAAAIARQASLTVTDPLAGADPATGLQVPAEPVPPGQFVVPPTYTASAAEGATPNAPVTVEIWVDSTGTIRKLVQPTEFGGETITLVSMTLDPYTPEFPVPDVTTPLTARQLVDFGL